MVMVSSEKYETLFMNGPIIEERMRVRARGGGEYEEFPLKKNLVKKMPKRVTVLQGGPFGIRGLIKKFPQSEVYMDTGLSGLWLNMWVNVRRL